MTRAALKEESKRDGRLPVQLELDLSDTPAPLIPWRCGRGLGECRLIKERNQFRCSVCRCTGPCPSAPASTIFDGYMRSQLKFLQSR
jgi:hypothetical protein